MSAPPRIVRGMLLEGDFDKLIVEATPGDVMEFAAKMKVSVAYDGGEDKAPYNMADPYLYDRFGRKVALVKSSRTTHQMLDVTSMGDHDPQWIKGIQSVEIEATALMGAVMEKL